MFIKNLDKRVFSTSPAFNNNKFLVSGFSDGLFTISNTFDDILETYLTGIFRNDCGVIGIPFANLIAFLHRTAFFEIQLGSVRNIRGH